jgi:hypothetical protein
VLKFGRVEHCDFIGSCGSGFALTAVEPTIELMLTEVSARQAAGAYESFSLLFEGPEDRPLPQGLFELSHQRLGTLEIFLVPVGVDGTRRYEAVFNRSAVEGET